MLFSEDGRSPGEVATILAFVAQFYRSVGVEEYVEVEAAAVGSMVRDMHVDFPYPGGSSQASPFKKVAQFVCYFTAIKPVKTPLPPEYLGHLAHQDPVARTNAVLALVIAIESLHGATLTWSDESTHRLKNKIRLSQHSFIDIADALTNATPAVSFKLVAVLFEQTAYKDNPDCQYPT